MLQIFFPLRIKWPNLDDIATNLIGKNTCMLAVKFTLYVNDFNSFGFCKINHFA